MRWLTPTNKLRHEGGQWADRAFTSADGRFSVRLPGEALGLMLGHAAAAGWRDETGGVLIGRYVDNQRTAAVTEVTGPPRGSSWGRTWFNRGRGDLGAVFRRRWLEGTYYLGEWHTHPGGTPDPSQDDVEAMRMIAGNPGYACPEPVLLILGGGAKNWTLAAMVVDNGNLVQLRDDKR